MTIYDNDLPPGVSKGSYLVNPFGSKSDGNLFIDPDMNKGHGGGGRRSLSQLWPKCP